MVVVTMPGALFLQGDQVNLRTIEEEDLKFLRDKFNLKQVRQYLHLYARKPHNLEQERQWWEEQMDDDTMVHLAICQEKEMMGVISLDINRELGKAEIGIWLDPAEHGQGYGTEASRLLINYTFSELRLHKICARAFDLNRASQRIWEKLGFEQEGLLREEEFAEGDYVDMHYYGLLKREWQEQGD